MRERKNQCLTNCVTLESFLSTLIWSIFGPGKWKLIVPHEQKISFQNWVASFFLLLIELDSFFLLPWSQFFALLPALFYIIYFSFSGRMSKSYPNRRQSRAKTRPHLWNARLQTKVSPLQIQSKYSLYIYLKKQVFPYWCHNYPLVGSFLQVVPARPVRRDDVEKWCDQGVHKRDSS